MLALNAVSPLFFSMAAGFLAQKAEILTRQDVPKINKVAFQVFLPCLLFYNVYTSDLSAAVRPKLILFAVIGYCSYLPFLLSECSDLSHSRIGAV